MDASTLTQRRKNQVVYANGLNRYATIANGCRPFLPPAINGASMGGYLVPVLVGGKVCIPCSEATETIATTPACSSASAVVPVFNCDYSSISGLSVYLDATDPLGTGVLPANGAGVATWKDLALPANNAVVPVGVTPPKFQLVSQNGLPGISFTNSTIYAAPFQGLLLSAALSSLNYTIFMVGTYTGPIPPNPNAQGSWLSIMSVSPGPFPNNYSPVQSGYSGLSYSHGFSSVGINWPTGNISPGTPHIFRYVSSPSNLILGVDGQETSSGNLPTPSGNISLGITYVNAGSIGPAASFTMNQLLIYNRTLTQTEYKNVEGCLSKKWSIPVV